MPVASHERPSSPFEVVDPPPVVRAAPGTRTKPIVVADDDEDETPRGGKKKALAKDEEDEREPPKKRKGKRGTKKSSPVALVLGGLGAVLAVGSIGAVIWYAANRGATETAGAPARPAVQPPGGAGPVPQPPVATAIPAGWTKYENPGFTVYFKDALGKPQTRTETKREVAFHVFGTEPDAGTKNRLIVCTWDFPPDLQEDAKNTPNFAFAAGNQEFEWGSQTLSEKKITVDGHTGYQSTRRAADGTEKLMRMVYVNGRLYYYGVTGPGVTEDSELARVFFDNVKFGGRVNSPPSTPQDPTKSTVLTREEAMLAAKEAASLEDSDVIVTDLIGPMELSPKSKYLKPEVGGTWGYYMSYTFRNKIDGTRTKKKFQLVYLGRKYAPNGPPKWYASILVEQRIRETEGDEWLKKNPIPGTLAADKPRVEVLLGSDGYAKAAPKLTVGAKAKFKGELATISSGGKRVVIHLAELYTGDKPAVQASEVSRDFFKDKDAAVAKYKRDGFPAHEIIIEGTVAELQEGGYQVLLEGFRE